MQAVTYIDEHKEFRTFKLVYRLKYAKTMVERIMQMGSGSAASTRSTGAASRMAAAAPAH